MLSDRDIKNLIDDKKLIIKPFRQKNVGCASIDLTLGNIFIRYENAIDTRSNNISRKLFKSSNILLEPGQFVLGVTKEKIEIPNGYYGFIETRGNFSRAGISVSCDDGHIDPGTDGLVTLEIKNNNNVPVKIHSGDLICQLFIFRLSSPCIKTYHGKYKEQTCPTIFQK